MATITSLGVGSGIDSESIVTQLMALENKKLTALQTKQSTVDTKISAFGSLSSLLDTLTSKLASMKTTNSLAAFSATSSNTDKLTTTASSTAGAGTYDLEVTQLAKAHKVNMASIAGGTISSTVGSGTVKITVGSGSEVSVNLSSASATIGDLRDAINASSAGVTAGIINTGSGVQLSLTAKDSGKTISFDTSGLTSAPAGVLESHQHASSEIAGATATTEIGSGTFGITIGGVTNSVNVDPGATLDDLRIAINGDASLGVTATIDESGTAAKLVLTGTSGKPFTVVSSGFAGTGANELNGSYSDTKTITAAQMAKFKVDGQTIETANNTDTTTIPGVTLNLLKEGTSTVTVARDSSKVASSLNDFVTSYNALNTKIKSFTTYDSVNKKANTLTGDSTTRTIQSQITSVFNANLSGTSGTYSKLAEIGVTFQKDGSLAVDSTKLSAAMTKDFDSVTSVVSTYASKLHAATTKMTQTGGTLPSKTQSLKLSTSDLLKQQDTMQLRLDAIEKRYRAQFSGLDTIVSGMKSTSSYLTQMIAQLNA